MEEKELFSVDKKVCGRHPQVDKGVEIIVQTFSDATTDVMCEFIEKDGTCVFSHKEGKRCPDFKTLD